MMPYSVSKPKPKKIKHSIEDEYINSPSPNFDERKRPIRFIMLHYTGMKSETKALELLRDPNPKRVEYQDDIVQVPPVAVDGITPPPLKPNLNRVSCNFLVFENGDIHQLVPEAKRAWHAGAGFYMGEKDMNSASIGIEIHNGGHDLGLPPFPEAQIEKVMRLVSHLKGKYGLDKRHIIGHSDWAPKRKKDPGEAFPWDRLAHAGISLHIPPLDSDNDLTTLAAVENESNEFLTRAQIGLKAIGYGIDKTDIYDEQTKIVLVAFQRRFRQSNVSGMLDVATLGKIEKLAQILFKK